MKILFVSTEAEPFSKTGGLADVSSALPKALVKQDVDIRVILPLYKSTKKRYLAQMKSLGDFKTKLSWREKYLGIFMMEHQGVTYYFIDNEEYFGRDNFYGYLDDGERFAYFSRAVISALPYLDFEPDILHCNEWQTALVPIYLKTLCRGLPRYEKIHTVFTIHNIEYQGKYDYSCLGDLFGISVADMGLLEYDGCLNLMKGAIIACDALTTVSPSYAAEIQYNYYAKGLEKIICENSYKLHGILNGIDTAHYNPWRDKTLEAKYSKNSPENKRLNKAPLQDLVRLDRNDDLPIIAMVGRLAPHKGIDLVTEVFDEMMAEDVQFVILGTGNKEYEDFFTAKTREYPGRVAACHTFSDETAGKIFAGADLFLMPSLCEPCGLTQMIAARYGTVPIVRSTGGLLDTIKPYNIETKTGNGITFGQINAHDMLFAIGRALELRKSKDDWAAITANCLASDFSWKKSVRKYIELYGGLL